MGGGRKREQRRSIGEGLWGEREREFGVDRGEGRAQSHALLPGPREFGVDRGEGRAQPCVIARSCWFGKPKPGLADKQPNMS